MTQVWAFRIHCNMLFPHRTLLMASARMLLPLTFILENTVNFATATPGRPAGQQRTFALSTTPFLVIVGVHQSETENSADPRKGGRSVGA